MTGTSAQKEIDEALGHSPLARAATAVEAFAQLREIDRSSAVSDRSRTSLESNGAGEAAPAEPPCTAGWSKRNISHESPQGCDAQTSVPAGAFPPASDGIKERESHHDSINPDDGES